MDIESDYSKKYTNQRVKKTKTKFVGDSVLIKNQNTRSYQTEELHEVIQDNLHNNKGSLLLGGERAAFFVTEDSRKYISPKQQHKKDLCYDYIDSRKYFDSLHVRYVKKYSASELQQRRIIAEFRNATDIANNFREALRLDLSPMRMWQVSLAGAVLFGMVSMSMIYKNLGQSAFATGVNKALGDNDTEVALVIESETSEKDEGDNVEEKSSEDKKVEKAVEKKEPVKVIESVNKQVSDDDKEVDEKKLAVDNMQEKEVSKDEGVQEKVRKVAIDSVVEKNDSGEENEPEGGVSLEEEAYEMVEGYPIEKMLPYILDQDPEVAKYLIAMAKQESQWGKRVPVLNGQDCYNYWGFRAQRKLMGSGGHTCFNSRKDAVETVGRRIHELIYKYDRKTAERLIVWKCGSSCAGHSQAGVDRWIGTVGMYYDKLSEG